MAFNQSGKARKEKAKAFKPLLGLYHAHIEDISHKPMLPTKKPLLELTAHRKL
ncbi:MAG: hypothetical protein Q8S55_01195 [Methylococcaceae bacterium]|nr:hypothetical protein [Methylococcaceae bacterium]